MSNKPLHITVILGTNRTARASERVATFIQAELSKYGVTHELVDVSQFDFPQDDYGPNIKDRYAAYAEVVKRTDGFIIVTPEYNRGYPGVLKSLLDVLYPEYEHRAVALVGVSSGPWGGARVVEHILPVLRELGLVATRFSLHVPFAEESFSPAGVPVDPKFVDRAKRLITEVMWLAEALRFGRANLHQ